MFPKTYFLPPRQVVGAILNVSNQKYVSKYSILSRSMQKSLSSTELTPAAAYVWKADKKPHGSEGYNDQRDSCRLPFLLLQVELHNQKEEEEITGPNSFSSLQPTY